MNEAWAMDPDELARVRIRWPSVYQWDQASDWLAVLKLGFANLADVEIVDDIPQEINGTALFDFSTGGSAHRVAINFSDYPQLDRRLTKETDLCFKMQFANGGYGDESIVPGGYVPDGKRLYRSLGELRKRRDSNDFQHDVFGRFGLNYARDMREKAAELLAKQTQFEFVGGMQKVDHATFLNEAADSRVCIDMPGLGPFCFRLINYLAIGACVVAYPHAAQMHVPLIDGEHIVYCKPDMSDLVELCAYYIEHDDEREAIARNAREYFDLNLHKDNLANYYLRTCLDRLS